jgi:hypothetical protein
MEKKKRTAVAAAVMAYISSEEAAAAAAAAQMSQASYSVPQQVVCEPARLPSAWAASGRSDMMGMRQMMLLKAFSGFKRG